MAVRVGLLGAGRIAGYFHLPILDARPDVRVVAIAEADPGVRDRAGAPGAVRFSDWRRLLDVMELDAVVVCLPPALHAPAAIAAFERGLHVYVEKPLALTHEEAQAMLAAWRAAGTIGMVGFNFRFHPLYEDMRARRRRGELGRIVAVRTLFTSASRPLPGWKADPRGGGSAIFDLATHHLDLVPHLAAEPIDPHTLSAEERRGPQGSLASITASLASGAVVQIMASQVSGHGTQTVELLGEHGHLVVDLSDARPRALQMPPGRLARLRRAAERLRHLHPAELLRAASEPSFARALGAFVEAVKTGRRAAPDLEDGRRALELALAAERAAAERRRGEPAGQAEEV